MGQPIFTLGTPVPAEEVGYARVSDADNQSTDMQLALLRKRGIPEGNLFTDEKSGRSMDRPGLIRALMLMEGRPGWSLVVYKLDRLGRDVYGLMKLMKEFEAKGWHLVSLTEAIDTRTAMGRAFFGMMGVFAQLESDLISERTRAGVARRREKGLPVGQPPKLTTAQLLALQERIENDPRPLRDVARDFGVTAGFCQKYFPGWRHRTGEERAHYRALHPLVGRPE